MRKTISPPPSCFGAIPLKSVQRGKTPPPEKKEGAGGSANKKKEGAGGLREKEKEGAGGQKFFDRGGI